MKEKWLSWNVHYNTIIDSLCKDKLVTKTCYLFLLLFCRTSLDSGTLIFSLSIVNHVNETTYFKSKNPDV